MDSNEFARFIDEIIEKKVQKVIKKTNIPKSYPCKVISINGDYATVQLAGNENNLSQKLNKTGQSLSVNDEVYLYSPTGELSNSYIDIKKTGSANGGTTLGFAFATLNATIGTYTNSRRFTTSYTDGGTDFTINATNGTILCNFTGYVEVNLDWCYTSFGYGGITTATSGIAINGTLSSYASAYDNYTYDETDVWTNMQRGIKTILAVTNGQYISANLPNMDGDTTRNRICVKRLK